MDLRMATEPIPFQQQFRILIDALPDPQGRTYSMSTIARMTELSEQALLYLLEGRSQNPRLDTLRRISRFFQISLDYFDNETEAECQAYLARHLTTSSYLLHDIAHESAALTPKGQSNALAVLEWIRRAVPSKKNERKNQ